MQKKAVWCMVGVMAAVILGGILFLFKKKISNFLYDWDQDKKLNEALGI